MKLLEAEIELREETRELEQARGALTDAAFKEKAMPLSETQGELAERTAALVEKIREIPEGDRKFPKEIALLSRVREVMEETQSILARPDTGPEAIAAETEVIELLLQTKRVNPKGGGGGGSSPGGGGAGKTDKSALALLGSGQDEDAKIEKRQIGQATGVSGRQLPDEFRSGLDAYFEAVEGNK